MQHFDYFVFYFYTPENKFSANYSYSASLLCLSFEVALKIKQFYACMVFVQMIWVVAE